MIRHYLDRMMRPFRRSEPKAPAPPQARKNVIFRGGPADGFRLPGIVGVDVIFQRLGHEGIVYGPTGRTENGWEVWSPRD